VWITKYRKKVLKGELANVIRDMLREECSKLKVDILKGHVSKAHIHRLLSIPPQLTISR
jgi:putative transposase